jgi:1-acyl-sn-glycerol-3-phosphate acyltransferase
MDSRRLRLALASFDLWKRYFRFEIQGFDVLAASEPAVIVGYHGGPWTFDLWLLGARMHEELGYFPRAFWDRRWWRVPFVREFVEELGGAPGPPDGSEIAALKARGEHLAVAPGGTREAFRPFWRGHRVDFGARRGYLRLAHAHAMPIIPVVATGLDETFLGLSDGPPWLGLGVGGIWPLALPFPAKITQRIGAPIRLDDGDLEEAHERVTATMQAMLDGLRAGAAW